MKATPPLPIRSPRLSFSRRMALYAIASGVWATGAAWLALHYFLAAQGPFGPMPHPLEFWSRAAHGAFAFASLWLFGVLWGAHVVEGWRTLRRRVSGALAFALFGWLVVSGYLLYYLGDDALLSAATLGHWTAGLAAPLFFLTHRFAKSRKEAEAQRAPG